MVSETPRSRQAKRGKSFPPGASTPEVAMRWADAVRMRAAGARLIDIARALGYADESGAKRAVEGGLRAALDAAGAAELRALELDRLDRLQLAVWSRALDGDDKALDRVLAIMKRRAELLGLDAPARSSGPRSPGTTPRRIGG